MQSLDDLPDLPQPAPFLLAALLLTFWLAMRIRIVRRQQERHGGEEASTWRWLAELSTRTWILPALAVLALVLGAATAATFLLR